jgi:arginine N-succinyltransferase
LIIVRAVRLEDLDDLWQLIAQATYGLTTLQITKEQLSERVELSNFAFTRKTEKPSGEPYVFVMEETDTRHLVGLSCIFSKTGGFEPFYSYRRIVETNSCEILGKTHEVELLQLAKIHDGPTEIGSLFLSPEYRGQGRGRLLSLARFTFLAAHPKRFAEHVIAEMRGVMSDDGDCPFWEAIGRHFFKMDFPQADTLSTINKRFIEDLMPHHPIYTSLLSESARAVMGDVHPHTRPALAMLEAEGFHKIDMIDIFDGGPVVRCRASEIKAVARTRRCTVGKIQAAAEQDGSSAPLILASLRGGFRALIGHAHGSYEQLELDLPCAEALQVGVGDPVLITALYPT